MYDDFDTQVQIDELFNSSRDIGIGKLPFYDMSDFTVNENIAPGPSH